MNLKALAPLLAGAAALGLAGCADPTDEAADASAEGENDPRIAMAELSPTQGHDVRGTVTFVEEPDGIRVIANVTGLSEGRHGFHIHENGDCSAPDASSAGGHFNPTNQPHAGPDAEERHVGDLGNLEAVNTGAAALERVDEHLSFEGENSILGKAVIVHAGADDLTSQPSGDAGGRVACGVIRLQ